MSDSNHTKRLVTVLSVAFNEEDCLEELIRRLRIVFDTESNYSWKAILVDNGSVDST